MKLLGPGLLLISTAIWGSAFVAQKLGADHFGPFAINSFRNLIGGAFLWLCLLLRNRFCRGDWPVRPNRRALRGGFFCGLLLFAAMISQQIGIERTTPGISAFLTSNYVLIVPLLAWAVGKGRPGLGICLGVLFALAGAYLISVSSSATSGFVLDAGAAWILLCAAFFAVHILVVDGFAPGCDMLTSIPETVNPIAPILAGSAGELNGAPRVMSEASDHSQKYRKAGDKRPVVQVTARQVVGSLNRQIWGGVNTFTSYYRWEVFSPDERRAINEEIGRTLTLTAEGRSAAEVALLYPADALMTGFEPKQTPAVGGALTLRTSDVFVRAVRTLFTAGHPFLLVDARSISEACVEEGALVNGPLRWRTVVLPNAVTLPIAAARKLAAFEAAGGRVIVLGQEPVNSEKAFPDAEIADLTAKWTRVKSVRHLAEAVARCHAPEIAVVRGPKEILRFSHRRTEKDGDVFFVANDSPESWKGAVRIAGDPATRVWNPRSGRFHEAAGEIALDLPPYGAVVMTTGEKVKR